MIAIRETTGNNQHCEVGQPDRTFDQAINMNPFRVCTGQLTGQRSIGIAINARSA
jgi:hypothetical protein